MPRPDPNRKTVHGIDMVHRTQEAEDALNQHVHAVVNSPSGAETMRWLRGLTLEAVLSPDVPSPELHYQEGMRMVVAMILKRAAAHSRKKENPDAQ